MAPSLYLLIPLQPPLWTSSHICISLLDVSTVFYKTSLIRIKIGCLNVEFTLHLLLLWFPQVRNSNFFHSESHTHGGEVGSVCVCRRRERNVRISSYPSYLTNDHQYSLSLECIWQFLTVCATASSLWPEPSFLHFLSAHTVCLVLFDYLCQCFSATK